MRVAGGIAAHATGDSRRPTVDSRRGGEAWLVQHLSGNHRRSWGIYAPTSAARCTAATADARALWAGAREATSYRAAHDDAATIGAAETAATGDSEATATIRSKTRIPAAWPAHDLSSSPAADSHAPSSPTAAASTRTCKAVRRCRCRRNSRDCHATLLRLSTCHATHMSLDLVCVLLKLLRLLAFRLAELQQAAVQPLLHIGQLASESFFGFVATPLLCGCQFPLLPPLLPFVAQLVHRGCPLRGFTLGEAKSLLQSRPLTLHDGQLLHESLVVAVGIQGGHLSRLSLAARLKGLAIKLALTLTLLLDELHQASDLTSEPLLCAPLFLLLLP